MHVEAVTQTSQGHGPPYRIPEANQVMDLQHAGTQFLQQRRKFLGVRYRNRNSKPSKSDVWLTLTNPAPLLSSMGRTITTSPLSASDVRIACTARSVPPPKCG